MKKTATIIAMIALLASCNTLKKIDCKSSRFIPVTFVLKSGGSYTINVPFCDTVLIDSDKMPDSAKLVLNAK